MRTGLSSIEIERRRSWQASAPRCECDSSCSWNFQGRRELLYGRTQPYPIQNLIRGLYQWPIYRAPTGALMSTTAKTFGDVGYVEFPLAAEAHAKTSVGELAEECRDFEFADRKYVIYQALAVFFFGIATFHLFLCHPSPADVAFGVQVAQSLTEQPHLRDGVSEINAPRAVRRISPRQNQFAGQRERMLVRSLKHER